MIHKRLRLCYVLAQIDLTTIYTLDGDRRCYKFEGHEDRVSNINESMDPEVMDTTSELDVRHHGLDETDLPLAFPVLFHALVGGWGGNRGDILVIDTHYTHNRGGTSLSVI